MDSFSERRIYLDKYLLNLRRLILEVLKIKKTLLKSSISKELALLLPHSKFRR